MPRLEKPTSKPGLNDSAKLGLDDSALIEFHKVEVEYPALDTEVLANLLDPYAPVIATSSEKKPTELENAA